MKDEVEFAKKDDWNAGGGPRRRWSRDLSLMCDILNSAIDCLLFWLHKIEYITRKVDDRTDLK
jgi:hypothetical protein